MSVKISELPSLETLADNDILAGVDTSEDTTSKITLEKIKNYATEDVYDKEEVDDTINDLQSQIDSLSTIYNAFPTVSDEGESMTLDDTAEVTFKKLDLKGNTSQYNTTGKNLLPNERTTTTENGITITKNDDGTYKVNGTATADVSLAINVDTFIPMSGTWRLLGCPSGGSASTYMLSAYVGYWGTSSPNIETGSGTNITYTGDVKARFYIKSGTTCNNLIFKPMITTDTTATIDNFEPYTGGTASPNPSYPSPINVVSGDNEINICGKNLFDSEIEIGAFDSNGKNESANTRLRSKTFAKVKPSTTYTLSWSTAKNAQVIVIEYADNDYNSNQIKRTSSYASSPLTITTSTTTNYIRLYIKSTGDSSTSVTDITNIMLEKSSTATTYEPYIGSSYPIYLGVENLFDIGTSYTDYVNQEDVTPNASNLSISGDTISIRILSGGQTVVYRTQHLLSNNTYYINATASMNGGRFYVRLRNLTDTGYLTSSDVSISGWTYNSFYKGWYAEFSTTTINKSIVIPNCLYWELGVGYASISGEVGNIKTITKPQIIVGNKAQYVSTTPIELCKIGDYQDYIYKDNGSWYLHKEIVKVVLNGSENWTFNYNNRLMVYIFNTPLALFKQDTNIDAFTTHYIPRFYGPVVGGNEDYAISYGTTTGDRFCIRDIRYCSPRGSETPNGTIEDFKTWLSSNNVIVYYVLATPTNTLIEDTTLIEQLEELKLATSYEGQTNISQENNDKPFILDVEAIKKLT